MHSFGLRRVNHLLSLMGYDYCYSLLCTTLVRVQVYLLLWFRIAGKGRVSYHPYWESGSAKLLKKWFVLTERP